MEITLGSIVGYLLGIPLVLLAILLTIQTPLGLIPLLTGLLIIPVVRRQIAKRVGIEFSRWAVAGVGTIAIVSSVVVLLVVVLSAASGGGAAVPGADVSNVSVTAEDASAPESSTALEVEWNSRAQSAVDPDPDDMSTYNANEGQKYVVVRMRIANAGNEEIELTPRLFRIRSAGVEYDQAGLFGSGNTFSGVTVSPGASYSAWTVYSVPEDTSEAQLVVYRDAYFDKNVSVSFDRNRRMPINMSD
jgi:hypothetical protein